MIDTQYEDMLRLVMEHGVPKSDRTGTGTRSVFGHQLRYNLSESFPLITTKKIHFHSVVGELIWLLSGSTNIKWLNDNGITIWDEWADADGELGPVYGKQWRAWVGQDGQPIDQIAQVLHDLRTNPDSRRIIVSAWNVTDVPAMKLPPCHAFFQFYVARNQLSCHIYQRSCDLFLGVPFNIASYALLTQMIAEEVGLGLGELVWTGGDIHIYDNHHEQVQEQLSREPRPSPWVALHAKELFDYEIEDVELMDYDPHPAIKAPVAV